jgi:RHS repeat-associated protein
VGNGGTVTGYAYTGPEFDPETGLRYYRAHYYYDPKIGRFLSEDPISLGGGVNEDAMDARAAGRHRTGPFPSDSRVHESERQG